MRLKRLTVIASRLGVLILFCLLSGCSTKAAVNCTPGDIPYPKGTSPNDQFGKLPSFSGADLTGVIDIYDDFHMQIRKVWINGHQLDLTEMHSQYDEHDGPRKTLIPIRVPIFATPSKEHFQIRVVFSDLNTIDQSVEDVDHLAAGQIRLIRIGRYHKKRCCCCWMPEC